MPVPSVEEAAGAAGFGARVRGLGAAVGGPPTGPAPVALAAAAVAGESDPAAAAVAGFLRGRARRFGLAGLIATVADAALALAPSAGPPLAASAVGSSGAEPSAGAGSSGSMSSRRPRRRRSARPPAASTPVTSATAPKIRRRMLASPSRASRRAYHPPTRHACGCRTDKSPVSAGADSERMDAVRFGRGIRALRRRRGWRQADLGAAARVSRAAVSRIELGHGDCLTIRTLEAVAAAAGARVDIRLTWNGEALDRLLDASHARLVDGVLARLEKSGWETVPEVSFSIDHERGSIDVLGFHQATGSLLVVEVKSVVPDIQAMLSTIDRKARLARGIGRERGWPVSTVSRLLVIGEDRTARRRVAAFEATFRRAFPVRGAELDRWLRSPDPSRPMAGLRFLTSAHHTSARHRISSRKPG